MMSSFNARNLSAPDIERKISICTFSAAGWVSLGGTGIALLIYHTIAARASVVSTVQRLEVDSRFRGNDDAGTVALNIVIPAKAGIQSVDGAFPKVRGVDSRLRGNDCGLERRCRASDATTLASQAFAGRT
jgi:hypothetical protein